jgi:hypothetical protein
MSVKPSELTRNVRPALRVFEGGRAGAADRPKVVAEILSDGTIRRTTEDPASSDDASFATGKVTGEGWRLWWDRRYWS